MATSFNMGNPYLGPGPNRIKKCSFRYCHIDHIYIYAKLEEKLLNRFRDPDGGRTTDGRRMIPIAWSVQRTSKLKILNLNAFISKQTQMMKDNFNEYIYHIYAANKIYIRLSTTFFINIKTLNRASDKHYTYTCFKWNYNYCNMISECKYII